MDKKRKCLSRPAQYFQSIATEFAGSIWSGLINSSTRKRRKKAKEAKGNVMNCRSADMMEAEATPPLPPQVLGSTTDHNDVRNLLTMARQLVDQGKPSQALQACGDGWNRGQDEGRLSLYLLGLGPSGEWQVIASAICW
ncbi:hypothetical protein OROGR_032961 [Orobanche gracilis]